MMSFTKRVLIKTAVHLTNKKTLHICGIVDATPQLGTLTKVINANLSQGVNLQMNLYGERHVHIKPSFSHYTESIERTAAASAGSGLRTAVRSFVDW